MKGANPAPVRTEAPHLHLIPCGPPHSSASDGFRQMKVPVQKTDPATIRTQFPIEGIVEGWFFRQREVSPGVYLVEGIDLFGRRVSRTGTNEHEEPDKCAADARSIIRESGSAI